MGFVRFALLICVLSPAMALAHSACEAVLVGTGPTLNAHILNRQTGEEKALALAPPVRLNVATWNMNLLNRTGCRTFRYKERSAQACPLLKEYLNNEKPDVLLLQEVWMRGDYRRLIETAAEAGYVTAGPLKDGTSHGLQLLIRTGSGIRIEATGFSDFSKAGLTTFEWLGWLKRGVMWAKFILPNGQKVLVLNTHLTPFAVYANSRARQVERMTQIMEEEGFDRDILILGGDLNIGADFLAFTERRFHEIGRAHWLYEHFANLTRLRDSYRSVHPGLPGYTFNPDFDPKVSASEGRAFQRLDYIWVGARAPGSRVHVVDSQLKFAELRESELPSDHYLLRSTLDVFQLAYE